MRSEPNLVVIDLDKIPAWLKLDLTTIAYDGILSSEVLSHLTCCARDREARDEEKLSRLLYGESVTV